MKGPNGIRIDNNRHAIPPLDFSGFARSPDFNVQWFDPELGVPVRGKGPDGSSFELRGIRVGAQPADLFTVPAGFQKIAPPQAQPGGASPQP